MVLTAATEGLSLGRGQKGELKEEINLTARSFIGKFLYGTFGTFNLGARKGREGGVIVECRERAVYKGFR